MRRSLGPCRAWFRLVAAVVPPALIAVAACTHPSRAGDGDPPGAAPDDAAPPPATTTSIDAHDVADSDADAADAALASPVGFVHVTGGALVDGAGRPLLLRAIGVGNWLVPEGYMWKLEGARGDRPRRIEQRIEELVGPTSAAAFWKSWRDGFFAEDDVARIRELGFNAVRVALSARLLLPEGQETFDEAGFGYLESLVAWCARHGVYVIFDMHAAPGGQTGANIDDSPNDSPELFTVAKNQDRLVTLWTEIARRFAASPVVLGYDLLNEPLAPAFAAHNAKLWPLYTRLTTAIRAVDQKHVIIVEGAAWANDWSALKAPFDDDLVYSFHKYWDDPTQASIKPYLDKRALWNRPLWVGEIGENQSAWYQAAFPLLEANDVGWGFWTWKKLESTNNPYAVLAPADWPAIQAYVRDARQKPSAAVALAALDELLRNVRLARCRFNRPAVCAVLPCK